MCNFADTIEANAIRKGEARGIKQGESQKGKSIAQRMLRSGKYSPEEISDITELPLDTVKKIQAQEALS